MVSNNCAPWIGQVPEKWNIKKVKYIVRFKYGDALPDEQRIDGNYTVYGSNGPVGSHETTNTLSPAIIVGRKGSFGKLHYIEEPGFAIDTTYFVDRRLTKNHLKWVYYALGILRLDELSKDSAVPGLSRDEAYSYFLSVPPYQEQAIIAGYLDKKITEIDALVSKKQELLKLLAEKRMALITQSVTNGLNPNIPMQDSGVSYLGQIPTHWKVKRFKFLICEPLKYGANESAESENRSHPRYIRITDIKEDGLLKEDTFKSLPEEIAVQYMLRDGDILLARSGATVGKSFIYRSVLGRACYAGYLIRARVNKLINPDYIFRFINSKSYWDWLSNIFIQATIQNVSAEKYANLYIPTPPFEEQEKILHELNNKLEQIERIVYKINEAIECLNEYRATLITNAITGKIDVGLLNPKIPAQTTTKEHTS